MLAYREETYTTLDPYESVSYHQPVFDENKVYEVFNEVLSNPIYE